MPSDAAIRKQVQSTTLVSSVLSDDVGELKHCSPCLECEF